MEVHTVQLYKEFGFSIPYPFTHHIPLFSPPSLCFVLFLLPTKFGPIGNCMLPTLSDPGFHHHARNVGWIRFGYCVIPISSDPCFRHPAHNSRSLESGNCVIYYSAHLLPPLCSQCHAVPCHASLDWAFLGSLLCRTFATANTLAMPDSLDSAIA